MAKKIIWTKRANTKFNNIISFLEEEWGEKVTESFVTRTYDIIELLARQSKLDPIEKSDKDIRGFLITKHNRLFYRQTANELILLNFYDTRSVEKKNIKMLCHKE